MDLKNQKFLQLPWSRSAKSASDRPVTPTSPTTGANQPPEGWQLQTVTTIDENITTPGDESQTLQTVILYSATYVNDETGETYTVPLHPDAPEPP